MKTLTHTVTVLNLHGLHARPATELSRLANTFSSRIDIAKGTLSVDAKSLMSLMLLAAGKGTKLQLTADGDDAQQAIDTISALFANRFGLVEETG